MQADSGAEIGIFGGSGFYTFGEDAQEVDVYTPFGAPSAPVTISTVGGRRVAFIPRHGRDHQYAPARVPARANLWAMRTLGVRQIIGPCAAGSLSSDVHPGEFVVLDQLVDQEGIVELGRRLRGQERVTPRRVSLRAHAG